MLTSTANVKLTLGVSVTDASQDGVIDSYVTAADAAVKAWTKRDLEQALYDQTYSPKGEERLALRQRPVSVVLRTAMLVQGSATATGVSGASSLVAGMPAVARNFLPVGCTVLSVGSTTVNLSAQATASGSVLISFGLAVWLDLQAYGKQGVNPFAASTHLWPGSDYSPDLDAADQSNSGLLIRLGGGNSPFSSASWPFGWPGIWGRRGTLTARLAPTWPSSIPGCVRAVYAAGYPTDSIPADLEMATRELALWLYRYAPHGGVMVTSEGYEGYHYALGVLSSEPMLGSTRQMLTRYRELAL